MAALNSTQVLLKAGALEKRAGSSAKTQTKRLLTASFSSITGTKQRWVSLSPTTLAFHEGPEASSLVKHSIDLNLLVVRVDPGDSTTLAFSVGGPSSTAASFLTDATNPTKSEGLDGEGGLRSVDALAYQAEFTVPEGVSEASKWVDAVAKACIVARGLTPQGAGGTSGGAGGGASGWGSGAVVHEHARHLVVLGTAHSAALRGDYAELTALLKDAAKNQRAREQQLTTTKGSSAFGASSSSSPTQLPRRGGGGSGSALNGDLGAAASALVNEADKAGFTPAQWAAMAGQQRALGLLLETGGSAALKPFSSKGDNFGDTLLHSCCRGLPPLPPTFFLKGGGGTPGGAAAASAAGGGSSGVGRGGGGGGEEEAVDAVACVRLVLRQASGDGEGRAAAAAAGNASGGGGGGGARTRKEADLIGSTNRLKETPLDLAIARAKWRPPPLQASDGGGDTDAITNAAPAVSAAAALVACLCLAGADASDSLATHMFFSSSLFSWGEEGGGGSPGGGQQSPPQTTTTLSTTRVLPLPVLQTLLRHGAKPNLSSSSPSAAEPSANEDVSSSPAGSLVTRLAAATGDSATAAATSPEEVSNEVECLVCLAAAGARVSPKQLAALPSPAQRTRVAEALAAWEKDTPTARGGTVVVPKAGWVKDKDSQACLSCVASKFTTTNRRHHCRFCAELVCGPCSTKRLRLTGESKPQRACDRCFNRESKPGQSSQEPAAAAAAANSSSSANSSGGDGGGGGSGLLTSSPKKTLDGGQDARGQVTQAEGAVGAGAETKRMLQENIEAAQRSNEKAETVKEAASEYRDLTRQLKEKCKSKSKSGLW